MRRVAIVGAGPGWAEAPFGDPAVEIWGCNDGYRLGLPRFSAWFEPHPFDRLLCTDAVLSTPEVPHGWYRRPVDYLAWLAALPVPLWVLDPPADWPHARALPVDDLRTLSRSYIASGPAWMLLQALWCGAVWIGVYGVASSHDYTWQRPNLEWLLGLAEGRGVTVETGPSTPLRRTSHVYGLEPPPPRAAAEASLTRIHALQEQRERRLQELFRSPLARIPGPLQEAAALDGEARAEHARCLALLTAAECGGTP